MDANHLFSDPDLASFYDIESSFAIEDEPCRALAATAASVLDLGCGTGRLTVTLPRPGCTVVGVDPAKAMLDVGRAKPGGADVTWIEGDARTVRLHRTFDLVLLTGHAFQVFLTSDDQLAVLRTISAHLNPDGRFTFDSRNPLAEAWRSWTREKSLQTLQHPAYGEVEAWHDVAYASETYIATYQTHYEARRGQRSFSASAQIRFAPQAELAASIAQAGLTVERWQGDWLGAPFTSASPEIIPLGGLA
jgi:SAM-dependent methyltransferase